MSEITEQQVQPGTGEKLAAGGGLASAIAGLIGASCCVLPIILFKIGVGSAVIGNLIFFADKTEYFLIGALLFITPGVIVSFWGGRRPGKRAILMFGLSAFIVLLAYILPSFEGDILRLLGIR
jgi:mercuric ion transport protein|tara:strand:+ start:2337 stop:2705 length:369 start_codon:yes stop_codon:yes gene_type:complete